MTRRAQARKPRDKWEGPPATFEVTLYTEATAPHLPVEDALRESHRRDCQECWAHARVGQDARRIGHHSTDSSWRCKGAGTLAPPATDSAECPECERAVSTEPVTGHHCAACNWDSPHVRKLRQAKLAKLRAYQRTGKLPPLPLPTDGVSVRVGDEVVRPRQKQKLSLVLPPMPCVEPMYVLTRGGFGWESTGDAAARYLVAMGETGRGEVWSCGCEITCERGEYGHVRKACGRHEGALEGREGA